MRTLPDRGRRAALLHGSQLLWGLPLLGCGGGGSEPGAAAPPPLPPAPPPPPPNTPTARLKAAAQRAPVGAGTAPLAISQGVSNRAVFSYGADARVIAGPADPAAITLATTPALWGFRRDRWSVPAAGVAAINGQAVYPVTRRHVAATYASDSVCALHFSMQGSSLEMLFAGSDPRVTLMLDGTVLPPGLIDSAWTQGSRGARLASANAVLRVDFGSAAPRRLSVLGRSSQGPCSLAFAASDNVQPWDRSDEPSMVAITDSYGGAAGPNFMVGGPFWEAAALLGIAHVDLDAIGGTGYAPNSAPGFGQAGDAFAARVAGAADTAPDLVITAGGINDNNSLGLFPYADPAAARSGFEAATRVHFQRLRAALPQAVLVALGPWAPRQVVPTDSVAQSKADAIFSALQAAGGAWVFLDNLNGGWQCSSGARSGGGGPWQTGTGTSAAPRGDGNADLYLSADGVHPNAAGCLYLGQRLAEDLRAALLSF